MKTKFRCLVTCAALTVSLVGLNGCNSHSSNTYNEPPLPGDSYIGETFQIEAAEIKYEPALDAYLFSLQTKADVASIRPTPIGQVNGAPVLGYVFVTSLLPTDIGYSDVEGTVALAVTSHPDFDDTPLWDEDNNKAYDDDGIVYHSHWVVLEENSKATAGLAVVQATENSKLTPTSPMAMYLDSPGYAVLEKGNKLHVIVPANEVSRNSDFTANALTAYLEVDATGSSPLLKVERIYDQLPGQLSIINAKSVPSTPWPVASVGGDDTSFIINNASVDYVESIDSLIFSVYSEGHAATKTVTPLGQVDGAPVLGYVFPTTIAPENVGFKNISDATLALAVTTHPDFDDTPLWDENNNGDYQDDGLIYHTHWVALVADDNSSAGLSVPSSFSSEDLPPTAPMAMYLDSPNFHAFTQARLLRIIVPAQRVNGVIDFNFDSVTAGMNVDLSGAGPVLRVNQVFDVLSDDLSLPYAVTTKKLNDL
jgi:hypothetical protein